MLILIDTQPSQPANDNNPRQLFSSFSNLLNSFFFGLGGKGGGGLFIILVVKGKERERKDARLAEERRGEERRGLDWIGLDWIGLID